MDIQRIFFSSYLALLYGAATSLLTDIMIRRESGEIHLVNILDPRIGWSTVIASWVYYGVYPRLAWWAGQDEFRHTLVKWKMRGSVFVYMTTIYPWSVIALTDILLFLTNEKVEHMFDRYSYAPPIAIIVTALCEWSGVNRTIRLTMIQP